MSNDKRPEQRRQEKVVMLAPDVVNYVEGKAPLFARGKRGGFSEALNRMVRFCMEYEEELRGKT